MKAELQGITILPGKGTPEGKEVFDRRNGEIPFSQWSPDEKVLFLHEVLDHWNRVPPGLAVAMLAGVDYDPSDRYSHGYRVKFDPVGIEKNHPGVLTLRNKDGSVLDIGKFKTEQSRQEMLRMRKQPAGVRP